MTTRWIAAAAASIVGGVLAVPMLVFLCGTTFALGAITRRPILVFFVPVAAVLLCIFFIWDFSPS